MSGISHPLSILSWIASALALLVLLFHLLGVTLSELGAALSALPGWAFAAVIAITLANQLVGVARWRTAINWFTPLIPRPSFREMFETTVWGSFLGQVLPPQVSMPLTRWAVSRNSWVVGTTLYEQLFDLVVLLAGSAGALLVFAFALPSGIAFAVFLLTLLAGCLAIRIVFHGLLALALVYGESGLPMASLAKRAINPLEQARLAPASVLATLSAWSILRLGLLALRVVIVAAILLPGVNLSVVAAGYPVAGLAMALPIMPAGLGLAEWSWTGLLVLAGATGSASATAAISFRIVNLVGLGALLIALLPFRMRSLVGHGMAKQERPHG